MIPWWGASILANVAIMGVEYFNNAGNYGSWPETLKRTGPLIIIAQWALYHSFSGQRHWLIAAAVFTLGNAAMRLIGVGVLQGHQIGSWPQVLAGTAAMAIGAIVLKGGLR
jgi:hypothetical protein